ncbi:MAG TPA: MaoC/PaaZ C-terminal domain-containing protein [Nocardioides sp.]|nr:MaoC/PaaZ C-terminal domain-containing protein [Nocardioides sp.]
MSAGFWDTGTDLPLKEYDVTRADLAAYAAASGDPNPIHLDESVALAAGLPGVVAHGMLTMALAARAVAEWTGGAEVVELGCSFSKPVVVPEEGTTLRVTGVVKELREGHATLTLQVTCGDEKVLGSPRAVVRV